MLIQNGKVNVDSKNENQETVLMHACAMGDVLIAQTLIDLGANIHKEDMNGWSPLMFTCSHGHASVADILIQVRNMTHSAGHFYVGCLGFL
jgi:ankyrin repeat protein